jgi:hypothetical protein
MCSRSGTDSTPLGRSNGVNTFSRRQCELAGCSAVAIGSIRQAVMANRQNVTAFSVSLAPQATSAPSSPANAARWRQAGVRGQAVGRRASSQLGLCTPFSQEASNSRRGSAVLVDAGDLLADLAPRLVQRQGLASVPIMATRVGLICTTRSSGTRPPADWHSPQKKDTRK